MQKSITVFGESAAWQLKKEFLGKQRFENPFIRVSAGPACAVVASEETSSPSCARACRKVFVKK